MKRIVNEFFEWLNILAIAGILIYSVYGIVS